MTSSAMVGHWPSTYWWATPLSRASHIEKMEMMMFLKNKLDSRPRYIEDSVAPVMSLLVPG
jgi:hypothetical protein